jgi:uncharacterized protein (DUF486 family)
MTLPQLKILREAVMLTAFVPSSVLYMQQAAKLDYLWASLCIMSAHVLHLPRRVTMPALRPPLD